MEARGIKPPLTQEEKDNLARGQRHILEAQARAHNKVVEERKLKIVARREKRRANG
jgi:hypothetical protein